MDQSLAPRDQTTTRDMYIISLTNKHLNRTAEVSNIEDLHIIDISGMSNETFIIAKKADFWSKIVIRFFKSKTSDFETEANIFKLMGKLGLGPKERELNEVYRVEECINGRPLTYLELRNPYIMERMMQLLCQFNYN